MDHSMHGLQQMAAVSGFDYTMAFLAGFFGSGHCLGMCGALVSGYFMNLGKNKSYFPYLMYQIARVSVYITIGMLAASLGVVLVSGGMFGKVQSILQMVIGTIVIILALGVMGLIPWQGSIKMLPMTFFRKAYASARTRGPIFGAMIAGFMNGLMPCPLTFAMYVEATSATTVLEGGALMLAFGSGTLPTMLLISFAFGKMGAGVRGLMLKIAALIMIVMGLNTINKGLSFFQEEDFKHRTFFQFLKQQVDEGILLLNELLEFLNILIGNIQGV
jgi:sulfite exporter TauE/SafE